MAYADLKNDVVFRKVFGAHPDVLRGLLNDLLDRQDASAITAIEYLPSEQTPLVMGMKLSILDVRCRDASGVTFVVEMQVLPVTGFLNRVVYNACKAYVGTLKRGHHYHELTDVIAVSICDFELWPDAEQRAHGELLVPLVSRWSMAERTNGARRGMGQVEFVFLELPKLGDRLPQNAVERWAVLFRSAPDLTPASVMGVPLSEAQRQALEFAREETMTPSERDQIERSDEEVDQVRRAIEHAEKKAREEGVEAGHLAAIRKMVRRILAARGTALTDAQSQRIDACDDATVLDAWVERLLAGEAVEDVVK
jgi:predicted transposase/invertase (TIGR01784 family)